MVLRPAPGRRAPLRAVGLATLVYLAACSDMLTVDSAPVGEGRASPTVVIASPTAGATLTGVVVFRASVSTLAPTQYAMVWTVDGVKENAMYDADGAEEATVDLSSWTWLGSGPYSVTFRARDTKGRKIGEASVSFRVGTGSTLPPPPPPPPPSSLGPLAGARFYVDPYSNAKKTADAWRSTRPADAAYMDLLASRPQADWFGDWSGDVRAKVDARTTTIVAAGAVPVFVAYDIPVRDCNSYSGGGATSADAYRTWIRAFAAGLASRRAVVVLEPDALAGMDCLTTAQQAERIQLLADAVNVLSAAGALVYLDAGNARWHSAATMAQRLRDAGVARAAGFAINVSNYIDTGESLSYAQGIRALLGSGGFVIDTSRNGVGSDGTWCNASGRALGSAATGDTGVIGLDALLYVKRPGESDGTCNGGPAAGAWWADYALGLAQRQPST